VDWGEHCHHSTLVAKSNHSLSYGIAEIIAYDAGYQAARPRRGSGIYFRIRTWGGAPVVSRPLRRNTDLNACNFFSSGVSKFIQNQFGATGGGPVIKDKLFFFGDYQGTRTIQGQNPGAVLVPSVDDRGGNVSDLAKQLSGTVTGDYWAQLGAAALPKTGLRRDTTSVRSCRNCVRWKCRCVCHLPRT
jgi:hypothetical protein